MQKSQGNCILWNSRQIKMRYFLVYWLQETSLYLKLQHAKKVPHGNIIFTSLSPFWQFKNHMLYLESTWQICHLDAECSISKAYFLLSLCMSRCPRLEGACTSSSCQNGGTCVDNWFWQQCNCKDGFTGKYCEKCMLSFTLLYNNLTSLEK